MLIINWTGLKEWRWIPRFRGQNDGKGIWFRDMRVYSLQISFYSLKMAGRVIDSLNKGLFKEGVS